LSRASDTDEQAITRSRSNLARKNSIGCPFSDNLIV